MSLRSAPQSSLSLFLSPHPDDVVYSAFSLLRTAPGKKFAVVFFNVSRFTRLGLLPTRPTSLARIFEDKMILHLLGARSKHLLLADWSARGFSAAPVSLNPLAPKQTPSQLFCPLGVGSHPDHVAVRNLALEYWSRCKVKPRLCFYEDLPYAARMRDAVEEEEPIVLEISKRCGPLTQKSVGLNSEALAEKMRFCNRYFTQNDHTDEFTRHARTVGGDCGVSFAERFYATRSEN